LNKQEAEKVLESKKNLENKEEEGDTARSKFLFNMNN